MHTWILTNLTDCIVFARLNYYLPSFLPPCHVSVCLQIGMSDTYIPNHLCLLLVVCCLFSDAFCLLFWLCLKLYAASCYCMPMCYLLPVAYFPPPVFCRLLQWQTDATVCWHLPAVYISICYLMLHVDFCVMIIFRCHLMLHAALYLPPCSPCFSDC